MDENAEGTNQEGEEAPVEEAPAEEEPPAEEAPAEEGGAEGEEEGAEAGEEGAEGGEEGGEAVEESSEPAPEPAVEFEPAPEPVAAPPSNKKTKVLVDPNASVLESSNQSHYLINLPVVPESDLPYTPILYTFRVRAQGKTNKIRKVTCKPPPFYLQFDHAIAVVWTLFDESLDRNVLGIVQLHWAVFFLQSLLNNEGIHSEDVDQCIEKIYDLLIDKYAAISQQAAVYDKSSKFGDYVSDKSSAPFSVNYSQMISKSPTTAPVLEANESIILDRQLLDELENVKKVVGIESIDLSKAVSKEQVMHILCDWKKEQMGKIEEELRMLRTVEEMIKNSDSQCFDGFTDEEQFEALFKKH